MLEMVEARRSSHEVEERHDLFSGLLDASQEEMNTGAALSDEELLGKHRSHPWKVYLLGIPGNMFILNLAGHEVGQNSFT